ncbi:MAG: hypothetical protein JO156_17400, partial [Solirubrobacterales bacterium]|nr:hypothetical protein [Solirubrobacterales bacterium]
MLMYLLGEKRPPWAHPIFFVVCSGFGWLGGVALVVALLSGAHERGLVVALALCAVGLIFLGVDLLSCA